MRISDWSSDVCSSDLDIPYSRAEIDAAAIAVLEGNGIVDGYVRPVAWRGSEMMAVSAQQAKIHVAVAAWQWPAYFTPEARLKGIRMTVAEWKRPSPETAPCRSKAAGLYMICTLSKHAADRKSTRLNSSHLCEPRMQSSGGN